MISCAEDSVLGGRRGRACWITWRRACGTSPPAREKRPAADHRYRLERQPVHLQGGRQGGVGDARPATGLRLPAAPGNGGTRGRRGHLADFCDGMIAEMTANLNGAGVWDGKWYRRYLFSDDRPCLGSSRRREGKMFLETQVWAVISQTANRPIAPALHGQGAGNSRHAFGLRLALSAIHRHSRAGRSSVQQRAGYSRKRRDLPSRPRLGGDGRDDAWPWRPGATSTTARCCPTSPARTRGEDVYINEPYAFSSTSADRAGHASRRRRHGLVHRHGDVDVLGRHAIHPGHPAQCSTAC